VLYVLFGVVILRREPLDLDCVEGILLGLDLVFEEELRLLVISISLFMNGKLIVDDGAFRLPDKRLTLDAVVGTNFGALLLSLFVAQAASVTVVSVLGPRILDSKSLTRASTSIGSFLLDLELLSTTAATFVPEADNCVRSISNVISSSSPPHLDQSLSIVSGSIGR